MQAGASSTFTLIRVGRGEPKPTAAAFVAALKEDRQRLGLPPSDGYVEVESTGPFPVLANGSELDEYVAWER